MSYELEQLRAKIDRFMTEHTSQVIANHGRVTENCAEVVTALDRARFNIKQAISYVEKDAVVKS